ncbi:MAG: hypothetical protein JWO55_117, partial [Candidatus Saccharibacteria bacterium]|nr:hypothetical protein [Candidatus Saccharibacteria bacterium]
MISSRQPLFQLNRYVIGSILALALMFAGSLVKQPDQAAAAGCNVVLGAPG